MDWTGHLLLTLFLLLLNLLVDRLLLMPWVWYGEVSTALDMSTDWTVALLGCIGAGGGGGGGILRDGTIPGGEPNPGGALPSGTPPGAQTVLA